MRTVYFKNKPKIIATSTIAGPKECSGSIGKFFDTKLDDDMYGETSYEKAESSSLGSMFPVTVGSVQSLCRERRLSRFPRDYFSTILVDEAHHCLADSYQHVLAHFPDANVLGVTATPDKLLKKQMGQYFDSLAYEYTMRQAIKDGYLCPIKAQMIPLGLDISGVGVSEGDYRADDIGSALEPYLAQIADEMQEYCRDRKTVVFLPLVSTSQKFCEMLKERGFRAAEVNGESPDRAQLLEDFDRGRYDVLTNSMLLTEGWDCPSVDCIINLRPTKVRSLYQQIIGRGLRLSPGKEYLLVLDFLWQTERLDLCRPSCLVCRDENEAERVDRMVEDATGAVDLMEAEEQAERDTILEREQSLARQLAEMRSRRRRLVDPLQFAMSIAAEDLADYTPTFAWEMAPPSQKQLDFLEKRGIDAGSIENMGKASMLIDRLMNRQKEGLSTPKQIRLLERYGGGIVRAEDVGSRNLAFWLGELTDSGRELLLDVDGRVVFSGVEEGLYLVEQTQRMDGFYPFRAFLAEVPLGGRWTRRFEPAVSPITDEPPCTGDLTLYLGTLAMLLSGGGLIACGIWERKEKT